MQQELSEVPKHILPDSAPQSHQSLQHGLQHHGSSGSARRSLLHQLPDGMSPRSERGGNVISDGEEGVNPDFLQERLRRLNIAHAELNATKSMTLGQRISEYENALTPHCGAHTAGTGGTGG